MGIQITLSPGEFEKNKSEGTIIIGRTLHPFRCFFRVVQPAAAVWNDDNFGTRYCLRAIARYCSLTGNK